MHPADSLETRLTTPRIPPTRPPFALAFLGAALLGALLLEACADDTPTAPEADLPAAAAMGMSADGTRIVIEPHWLTLDTIGVSGTLTAVVTDAAGDTIDDAAVTWESADASIATVDTAGVVTSVEFGRTRVTATHDSATAWATVEVAPHLGDREILEIFYEATGGDDWADNTNWLSDADLSEWHGVGTDEDGRVRYLELPGNELAGEIPAEIGGLGGLSSLRLHSNDVSGAIPAELGKLTRLRRLELDNNELAGGLPPEMGGMKALNYLDVAHNRNVMGIVPHTFAGLDLGTFYSTDTELCVPPSLKAWFDEIPETDNPTPCTDRLVVEPPSLYFESLGDTITLSATAVGAEGDTLYGAAVTWTSGDAAVATVDSTGLVTTTGYGTTQVAAASDSLTDTVDVEVVFKLSDREILEILYETTDGGNWTDTTNWLSDEPLSEWFGIRTDESGKVDSVGLRGNNLSGSIPSELGELDSLLYLDLSLNDIGGHIPGELGALKRLSHLHVTNNSLEGSLPDELGDLTALRHLHIHDNDLDGVVPGSFAGLDLETFRANESGVCVPPSLDEWFQAIENTDDVARCVASIAIAIVDQSSLTFYWPGETATLATTYVDAEGDTIPDVTVTWSSGDTAVVSVDATGKVTAVGRGTTEVTATRDSTSASIAAEVTPPEDDRDVLEFLHERTGGDGWTDATNWLTDQPLSEWAGVETDDSGRVVGLSLSHNNLRGPIHPSIGRLDRLVTLDLGRNWLTGTIPAELGELSLLRELVLRVNGLVGALPAELGALDSLRTLNLAVTGVSGMVPASFADLELESFLVNGSALCVPPSLAGWLDAIAQTDNPPECAGRVTVDPPSLTFGATGDTARLSATVIDGEGGVVEDPEVTWTSGDTLVAMVDPGTGLVTALANGVVSITATYDSVSTGSAEVAVKLPGSDRIALEAFYHATGGDDWTNNANWLSDQTLDEWHGVSVASNGRIEELDLSNNNLGGHIPGAIGLLDGLGRLDLGSNVLAGPIPASIGRLTRLRVLYLEENEGINGPLPPEMGDMTELSFLDLSNTALTGPLPETFANLAPERFYHANTGLCVPRSLAAWYELLGQSDPRYCVPETPDRKILVDFYNTTRGPDWDERYNWLSEWGINTWAGVYTDDEGFVTKIDLPYNRIAGPVPPEFGKLARLERLFLFSNALTGTIPPELGNLTNLIELHLDDNKLEGTIPPELGNLSNLEILSLSYNAELTGSIPPELGNLTSLEHFHSYWCGLSGPIPPELGTSLPV